MNIKKILLSAILFFMLLGIGIYFGNRWLNKDLPRVGEVAVEQTLGKDPGDLLILVLFYDSKYSEWPHTVQQLQKMVKENNALGLYDLDSYRGLSFSENSAKQLTIRYKGYEKGSISTGPGEIQVNFNDTANPTLFKKVKLNPKTAGENYALGCDFMLNGKKEKAISYFSKALGIKSKFGAAYLTRGECFNSEGKYDQAIKDLTKAIQYGESVWIGMAYYARGQAYMNIKNNAAAKEDFKKAVENTKNEDSLYSMAEMELAGLLDKK